MVETDKKAYIERRRGRYMAQILTEFEAKIEPLIDAEVADEFKGVVRRKITALAADSIEIIEMRDQVINGHGQAIRDAIAPDGAAQKPRSQT